MKNLLFILFVFFNTILYSQMVVSDPTNTAIAETNSITNSSNLAKTTALLAKASSTLSETKKSVKILKDAKDAVEKVSSILKDLNSISTIISLQTALIDKVTTSINRLNNSNLFSTNEIMNISKTFNTIVISADKSVGLAEKILGDDLFKMKDGERLNFLKDIETELKTSYNSVNYFTRKYNLVLNNRMIKRLAKNN